MTYKLHGPNYSNIRVNNVLKCDIAKVNPQTKQTCAIRSAVRTFFAVS